ncbi:MAG TPA: 4-alpha-glucanotransferase [Chitinophagaceae bacterium]|nr:4-alpha-glucanotransferase [Chitinophagaceae bacterium]
MKIDFYLRFSTRFGQSLYITGNLKQLGCDDASNPIAMSFLNEDFWHLSIETESTETVHYRYIYKDENGVVLTDGEAHRLLPAVATHITVVDSWNFSGQIENVFFTAPFQEVLLKQNKQSKSHSSSFYTHSFKVKAPLLTNNECICLLGNCAALKNWETEEPVLLRREGQWWKVDVDLEDATFPLSYKYGIYHNKKKQFVAFEEGDNRTIYSTPPSVQKTFIHDGFINFPHNRWKGAGVAIPVFSLRSKESFGIGEFADIPLLVDWAEAAGLQLIQLLPINDTTATYSWRDSYPYAAISAFALHPLYINLEQVAGKEHAAIIKALSKKKKQLNELAHVEYETVLNFKINTLRELFELNDFAFLKEAEYKEFFEANKHWLVPYAAFCFLRDKYGTSEFGKWKSYATYSEEEVQRLCAPKSRQFDHVAFWYFVQYHLHLQLKDAVKYAHKKGLVLKGDIPIGIYRNGCDAWTAPELYHMEHQAGAPPDDFAVKGQNWGFPTYNWQKMQENHFEWWRLRFEQMSHYFDAFRIDHILGFFRIWSIPVDAVEGIMGRFVPALAMDITEFSERGIWFDYNRFCKPFIEDEVIRRLFGAHADFIITEFLQTNERGGYDLKEAFDTQKKIEAYFEAQDDNEDNALLKQGLFDLVSNVLLFEEEGSEQQKFHFRISIDQTTSFQFLDDYRKDRLRELYYHYFYHRHDQFWKTEALRKLPALKEATNMLICGEDLGMVPHSVPDVMKQLAILSLEIQRMPKDPKVEFFHPKQAPYLSVVTPSTHDMSTIRGWWEEDREKTQRFFNYVLGEHGSAPHFCEPWINRAIIMQHFYSPAMWSIFQLQDLLGMSAELRRENPHEERINIPADPAHYWRYRMHMTLEQLLKEKEFTQQIKELVQKSGRA